MKQLLAEKYRPKVISDYIFHDDHLKAKALGWLASNEIPNLFFFGTQGTGKSTLAKILVDTLIDTGVINDIDVKRVKASIDNGVDLARRLEEWVGMRSMGEFKIVYLEEADQLTPACQKALRSVTEDHSDSVRFILTGNYPKQLIPSFLSRFEIYELSSMDKDQVMENIINIIVNEEIDVSDPEILNDHIDRHSPDERAILNSISRSTVIHEDGTKSLGAYVESASGADVSDWVEYWNSDIEFDVNDLDSILSFTDGIEASNFEQFYEAMYLNSNKFGAKRKEVIIILSQMLARSYQSANHRLNIESCLYMIESEFRGD